MEKPTDIQSLLSGDEKRKDILIQKVFCRFLNKEVSRLSSEVSKAGYPKNEYLFRLKEAFLAEPNEDYIYGARDELLDVLENKFGIEEQTTKIRHLMEDLSRKVFYVLASDENIKLFNQDTTPNKKEVNKANWQKLIYKTTEEFINNYISQEDGEESRGGAEEEDGNETDQIDFSDGLSELGSDEDDEDEEDEEIIEVDSTDNKPKQNGGSAPKPSEEVLTIEDDEANETKANGNDFLLENTPSLRQSVGSSITEEDIAEFKRYEKFKKLREQVGDELNFEEYLRHVLETMKAVKPRRKRRTGGASSTKANGETTLDNEEDNNFVSIFEPGHRVKKQI